MKKIIGYIKDFYHTEFRWGYFLLIVLFLALSVYTNYYHDILQTFRDKQYGKPLHLLNNWIYNTSVFGIAFGLYALFSKDRKFVTNYRFWLLVLLAAFTFALRTNFKDYQQWISDIIPRAQWYFWMRCANNIFPALVVMLPITIFWLFVDRRREPLYGFRLKDYDFRPYIVMILLMVPLIVAAAFQSDFLQTYPRADRVLLRGNILEHEIWYSLLFEFCYGLDFISIEFFFRGFLILAFARFLGKGVIIPAATFYVFIHFGKPMGEAISSFFGGLLLGIISYNTRSIAGGIMVHVGIAWTMELTAFLVKSMTDWPR